MKSAKCRQKLVERYAAESARLTENPFGRRGEIRYPTHRRRIRPRTQSRNCGAARHSRSRKDNIDTADQMKRLPEVWRCSTRRLQKKRCVSVEQLREIRRGNSEQNQFVRMGKFATRQSLSGWSGRSGQTKAYLLDRSPCGSSNVRNGRGGRIWRQSASAQGTDGSIVCPASVCGIVGFKPTLGVVSRSSVIPPQPARTQRDR